MMTDKELRDALQAHYTGKVVGPKKTKEGKKYFEIGGRRLMEDQARKKVGDVVDVDEN